MTSAERIAAAFDRSPVDRIPFGEIVIDQRAARTVLGRETPVQNIPMWLDRMADGDWKDLVEQEALDRIELARTIGLDIISVDLNYPVSFQPRRTRISNQWICDHALVTYDPVTMITYTSTAGVDDLDRYARDLLDLPAPQPPDHSSLEVIHRIRHQLDIGHLDIPMVLRDYTMSVQHHLELLASYPQSAEAYFKHMSDTAIEIGKAAIAEGVSIIGVGGHVGARGTSMISNEQYRHFILPGVREQIEAYHALGAWAYIASGGCIWPLADAFLLESGAKAYAGIDTFAGMNFDRLRDQYGGKICFIGGIDSVETLCHGSEVDVRNETMAILDTFQHLPGFILASSNSIHNGVKPENFIAMIAAYREYYGL